MRILAIGDIHGCSTALDTLLNYIDLRPQDQLITLGDYVDRGEDTKGVIDRLIKIHETGQLISLKGNHEAMMLEARRHGFETSYWIQSLGKKTLASYTSALHPQITDIPQSHWDFIENHCVDSWETEQYLFVHANLDPCLPLDQQSTYRLFWQKFENPSPHYSGKVMICGHTSQKDGLPLNVGYAICIDTWVYGETGWLTCLDVQSGQMWQANQKGATRTTNIAEFRLSPAELATLSQVQRTFPPKDRINKAG